MQISDEMLGEMIYRALYQHQGGLWECVSPRYVWYDAASRLRAALSALSPPVQPVADGLYGEYTPISVSSSTATLPVPPTKGPEDEKPDRFAYWNSLPESEKAKIRQSFHDDMFGGSDD